MHYLVFQGRDTESGSFAFCGPFTYRAYGEADYAKLLDRRQIFQRLEHFKRLIAQFDIDKIFAVTDSLWYQRKERIQRVPVMIIENDRRIGSPNAFSISFLFS